MNENNRKYHAKRERARRQRAYLYDELRDLAGLEIALTAKERDG